jgi:hypothetical protein
LQLSMDNLLGRALRMTSSLALVKDWQRLDAAGCGSFRRL